MHLRGAEDAKKHMGLGFQAGFALLSQISFFLCKACIAWRGKNIPVPSQKGRVFNLSSPECYYVAHTLPRSVSVKQIWSA